MPSTPAERATEPVTVVIPVYNVAARVGPPLAAWADYLDKLSRPSELLVVDDGSTDGTAAAVAELAGKRKRVRVLTHESHRGFGASLRTALAASSHPLFFYTSLDYPYTPADLGKLLNRIGDVEHVYDREMEVAVASGYRNGRPAPVTARVLGGLYRGFCRFALGYPIPKRDGWLGWREQWRNVLAWQLLGNPLQDVNCAFKLFRRSVFDKFPIQSDGDFVHAELIAKANFTTCLMDEQPLTPKPDPVPAIEWRDLGKVLRDAKFTPPPVPVPVPPPTDAPADSPPSVSDPTPVPQP